MIRLQHNIYIKFSLFRITIIREHLSRCDGKPTPPLVQSQRNTKIMATRATTGYEGTKPAVRGLSRVRSSRSYRRSTTKGKDYSWEVVERIGGRNSALKVLCLTFAR